MSCLLLTAYSPIIKKTGFTGKKGITMFESVMEKRIMWGDLDALGIVFYPRYYEWIDGCAHQFFEAIGAPHDQLWETHGIVFGLAETQCRYKQAGRYHQRINMVTRLAKLSTKGLTLKHTITKKEDGSTMLIAIEKRICLDARDRHALKITTIPKTVYNLLEKALHETR